MSRRWSARSRASTRVIAVGALALLGACGRLSFDPNGSSDGGGDGPAIADARPDATLVNHDEDGDTLDDAVDPCPFLFGDSADSDGDGVGDNCDPDGSKPHSIKLFDSMQTLASTFTIANGTWIETGDVLRLQTVGFAQLDRAFPVTDAEIYIGYDITSISGNPQQLIIHASTTAQVPRYYGQLYKNTSNGANELTVVSYDGLTFGAVGSDSLSAAGVHTGRVDAHLSVRTSPPSMIFGAAWAGEPYGAGGTTPSYVGSPVIRFAFDGMLVDIRYLCVIAPAGA